MTFTCAHTRSSGYPRKSPRRLLCSNRQSHAIPVTARRWLGPRSAVIGCFRTIGAQIHGRCAPRASITLCEPWKWPATTRPFWQMPPTRSPTSARILARRWRWLTARSRLTRTMRAAGTSAASSDYARGQPEIAIEHGEAALRLSPRARVGSTFFVLGQAYFVSRRFDEAIPRLRLAIQENPNFAEPYRNLAACFAHMGRLDEAREIITRLRAVAPVVMPDASEYRN